MSTLSNKAIEAIGQWADQFNPAAGQALIDAAARSPYLTSQFNQFVATGGEFAAPAANLASAQRLDNGRIRINIGTQLASDYLGTPVAKDQLATVFAHEMGHALSPGGMPTSTVIPTKAVEMSRRAEGVALTSEMIVSYQLGLGSNGNYSYSDRRSLNQPPGALAQQFSQQISHENDAVSLWTLDSTLAKSFVNYSVSPIAQTYGLWIGQAKTSVAPKLTYDQYNEAYSALNACGPDNAPNLIDWLNVQPGSVQLNTNPDGSCRITTPRLLPRLDGRTVRLDATLNPAGNAVVVNASLYRQSDGKIDTDTLSMGPVSYNLFDAAQNNDASYKMWQLNQNNGLSSNAYNSFTQQSSNFVVDYSLGGTGSSGLGLQPPPSWSDPIGALYDSQSSAFDNAASIANKTTRAMNAQGQGLSAAQLAALDTNNDGQLSTAEASGVRLWADVNEDGHLDSGELLGVSAVIKSADYGFYTRGSALTVSASADAPLAPTINVPTDRPQTLTANAPGNTVLTATVAPVAPGNPVYARFPVAIGFTAAALPAAPGYGGVPASNYRSLRDTSANDNNWGRAA